MLYTVTSKWSDGMVVKSRPMSAARIAKEHAELTGYITSHNKAVLSVSEPRPYTGKISHRDWALIREDEAEAA